MDKPLVIVSKSEPENQVAKLQAFGLNAQWGEAGTDYVWYPHSLQFGIERKTVSNLLQSLGDRQLVEQAHRGAAQFTRYILLIEGAMYRAGNGRLAFHSPGDPRSDASGIVESGWEYSAVSGMLLALQLMAPNIMLHHWPVLYDSATAIANIVHATSNPEASKFIRERQRPTLPAEAALGGELYEDAVWALCALPGLGPETAMSLLAEYGTLSEVIDVIDGFGRPAQLENHKVNGHKIGAKRAAKIREAVVKRFN